MEFYAALIFGHTASDLIKYRNLFSVTVLLSSLSRGVPGSGKFLDRGVLRIISSSKNISGFEFCWNFIGILPEFCRTHVSVNGNIPVKGIALYHCTLLALSYILTSFSET